MALSDKQMEVLRMVRDERVRYAPVPLRRKDKPFYLVDGRVSDLTLTLNSLKRRDLIRPAYPTIRTTAMILTPKGEKVI